MPCTVLKNQSAFFFFFFNRRLYQKELHVFGDEIFYMDSKYAPPTQTPLTTSIYLEYEI